MRRRKTEEDNRYGLKCLKRVRELSVSLHQLLIEIGVFRPFPAFEVRVDSISAQPQNTRE